MKYRSFERGLTILRLWQCQLTAIWFTYWKNNLLLLETYVCQSALYRFEFLFYLIGIFAIILIGIDELLSICSANGLILSNEEAAKLGAYAELLRNWNAKINLISRKDEDHIFDSHILHSLTLRMPSVCNYDLTNKKVADFGTGGGLPGIPLKIVTPSTQMTLMDSIQKKITACNAMISELGLTGITAKWGRAEELACNREHAQAYDVIVSRAVAPLDELAKWSKGLLKPDGILFALKGGNLQEEISLAHKLKFVKQIEEKPLDLVGYDAFMKDVKKLVIVSF
jgi:16S rRNA (guanine527-N7)-methyltransferase